MSVFNEEQLFELQDIIKSYFKLVLNYVKTRDVKSPNFGTSGSNGLDVFIPNDFEPTMLLPQKSILIDMGIHFRIEGPYGLQVNNKSGVAVKKELVYGAHLIDQDYTGELKVNLINVGRNSQELNPGDKIVQLLPVFKPEVELIEFHELEQMLNGFETERGFGGFGSTGVK